MMSRIANVVFIVLLVAGLGLALAPNSRGKLNHFMPRAVYLWIDDDRDIEKNLIAFSILGPVALCSCRRMGFAMPSREVRLRQLVFSREFRLIGLLALVCGIELVQTFIPGRVGDIVDVCTGWSGIFFGWLLAELLDARARDIAA